MKQIVFLEITTNHELEEIKKMCNSELSLGFPVDVQSH